jgi:hypothetical protein
LFLFKLFVLAVTSKPWVLQDLRRCFSVNRFLSQQRFKNVSGGLTYVQLRNSRNSLHVGIGIIPEEASKSQDTTGEEVHTGIVDILLYYLGSDKPRCTTSALDSGLPWDLATGQSKVYELQIWAQHRCEKHIL